MIEKERLFKIDGKRIVFFLTFAFMFVLTEIGRKIYRPYIYANDIFDFWIADTIGNFTGTIAIVFFNFVYRITSVYAPPINTITNSLFNGCL